MTDFPALAAHARQHNWPDGGTKREIRERAGIFAEYDNEFEAQRLLRQADDVLAINPEALVILAEAQTRATLHLAKLTDTLIEQQRLGNLIAWSTRPGFKPSETDARKINEGLGL